MNLTVVGVFYCSSVLYQLTAVAFWAQTLLPSPDLSLLSSSLTC